MFDLDVTCSDFLGLLPANPFLYLKRGTIYLLLSGYSNIDDLPYG